MNSNTFYAVATDLTFIAIPANSPDSYTTTMPDGTEEIDACIDGKIYRAISPNYFAWLHSKIINARARYGRKQLPAKQWELLKSRYNAMLDVAEEVLGADVLKLAIDNITSEQIASYMPPTAQKGEQKNAANSNQKSSPHTLDELYNMTPGTLSNADYHVMWIMMGNGTWLPPLDANLKDPFAVEQQGLFG